jgi:hypothetical protein
MFSITIYQKQKNQVQTKMLYVDLSRMDANYSLTSQFVTKNIPKDRQSNKNARK